MHCESWTWQEHLKELCLMINDVTAMEENTEPIDLLTLAELHLAVAKFKRDLEEWKV